MKHKDSKNFPFLSLLYSLLIVAREIIRQCAFTECVNQTQFSYLYVFYLLSFNHIGGVFVGGTPAAVGNEQKGQEQNHSNIMVKVMRSGVFAER